MPIRAIVFDFDGVLADSEGGHEAAIRATAQDHGMGFTHEQYANEIIGFDDRDAFRYIQRLSGREPDDVLTTTLAREKTARFEAMVERGEVGLYEGVAAFVRQAADRVPVAVCSGAAGNEIRMMLRAAGLVDLLKTIVSADDVAQSKPDPEGYAMAVRAVASGGGPDGGFGAGECLAIEDTVVGLTAARGAGLRVAGVATSTPREAMGELEAHAVKLTDFSLDELLAL